MLPNALQPSSDDIKRLNSEQAVDLLRDILHAEAGELGVSPVLVTVPSNINAPDGGVDAHVDADIRGKGGHGIVFSGHTYYQVKTGAFKASTESELKSLLFPPSALRPSASRKSSKTKPKSKAKKANRLGASDFNYGIRDCLEKRGTLVIALFGFDGPQSKAGPIATRIKTLIAKLAPEFKAAKVKVWSGGHIAKLSAIAPAAALSVRGIRGPGAIHSVQWMGHSSGFEGRFLAGEDQEHIVKTIRETLTAQGGPFKHIRVVGDPGIGKSRLVFEALNDPELGPSVLYSPSAEALVSSDILTQLEWAARDTRLILVVDECAPENRTALHQRLRATTIRLITIYSEFDESDKSPDYALVEPGALTDALLTDLLASYGLPPERIRWLVPLIGGSPRVAHAVGASLAQSDKIEEILSPKTLDNVWDHYIAGRQGKNSPAYHGRHVVLASLALFKRFGAYFPVAEEARTIHSKIVSVVDSGISWAKFTATIRDLQARRILQGTATLYITPKLLHIKLWCDWWQRYSGAISPPQLLDGLTDRLAEWLGDMFVYANESAVASNVVEQLLAPDGYFSKLNAYAEEKGGNLFFALAQANPKAASRVLKLALGDATSDQLLDFSGQGRRYVVHALEHIALFADTFVDAAEALLALAEAENETWSNNSTGVFVDLFTLGYGKVASSELPPDERLPVLERAIRSDRKKVRDIAVKAFSKSLQTHFSRASLGETHGLRELPPGWMPKTYGELFDAYRVYLVAFWSAIKTLPFEERPVAIRELLGHSRSLIGMKSVQPVLLGIFDEVARDSEDMALVVIEEISTILHYERSNLTEEVRARLNGMYEALAEGSYHARLRRNISLQLVHDHFDDKGEYREGPSEQIARLADNAVQDSSLLTPELHWLVTESEGNGHAFGFELGKRDAGAFWNSIFSSWVEAGDKAAALFIGGYLAGTFATDVGRWESAIEEVAGSPGRRLLPLVVCRSGMSPHIAELLLDAMRAGRFERRLVRVFAYGQTGLSVPFHVIREMIEILLAEGDRVAAETSLELWSHAIRPRIDVDRQMAWDLAVMVLGHDSFFEKTPQARLDTMTDYYWKESALTLYKARREAGIRLALRCLEHLGEDGTVVGGYHSQTQEFLALVTREHPEAIWKKASELIGPPMDTRAFHILSWLRGESGFRAETDGGTFELIPNSLVIGWIDEKPQSRAPYIARYVPNRFLSQSGKATLFREMLERYGKDRNVRSALHANFHTEGWSGSAASHYVQKLESVRRLLSEEGNVHVRRWLNEEVEDLTSSIQREQAREERY